MKFQEIGPVSGGKDFDVAATLLAWRQQRTGRARDLHVRHMPHEDDWTYEQVDRLENRLGITVERIKQDFTAAIMRRRKRLPVQWRAAGAPEFYIDEALSLLWPTGVAYLDLVLSKGMFAAGARMKFCTEELHGGRAVDGVAAELVTPEVRQVVMIAIDRLDEPDWNPNDQSADVFGSLVTDMLEYGFLELLVVAPVLGTDRYRVTRGNHRKRAAMVTGMTEAPCYVVDALSDEDEAKIDAIRGERPAGEARSARVHDPVQ